MAKDDKNLEGTINLSADDGLDDELRRRLAQVGDLPAEDGTMRLSSDGHDKAAQASATPFRGEAAPPPRLTGVERDALQADSLHETVAMSGAGAVEAAVARAREATSPEEPSAGPAEPSASSASPAATKTVGPDGTQPFMGATRSTQETRQQARILAELLTTEDDELERFAKRRVAGELDPTSLARIRDILRGLSELLHASSPEDAKALTRAWEELLPSFAKVLRKP